MPACLFVLYFSCNYSTTKLQLLLLQQLTNICTDHHPGHYSVRLVGYDCLGALLRNITAKQGKRKEKARCVAQAYLQAEW